MPGTSSQEIFMLEALEQAKRGAALGEVPIGAVIVQNEQIISRAFNQIESLNDATAHAEILAIREASKILRNWRLEECSIYITLEPCPMCLGAIRLARIKHLVIGTMESRLGAISKFASLANDTAFGPVPTIESGILKEECQTLLKNFFQKLRE